LHPSPACDLPIDHWHIYSYEIGKEIELQTQLRALDTNVSLTVYLLTMRGRDSDAAVGLCAALRQEILLWDIRLAIFESSMDFSTPIPLLVQHIGIFNSGENVILFDQWGAAHVLRVGLTPRPPCSAEQNNTTLTFSEDSNYVAVRVSHWAGMSHLYDGFVARVTQSHHPSLAVGNSVVGVAKPSAEFLRIHINNIVSTPEDPDPDFAGQLLGILLSSLVHFPPSGPKARMAVAIENYDLAQIMAQHGRNIPRIQLVLPDFRDPDVFERLDILVSDSATYAQYHHLHRWIPRSGKVFLWDELLEEAVRTDPSYIRRTLADTLKTGSEIRPEHTPTTVALAIPCNNGGPTSRSRASPPFRSDRTYVLLGGIGGLGIDLAVWMYQVIH
jgi:hypothetical protein